MTAVADFRALLLAIDRGEPRKAAEAAAAAAGVDDDGDDDYYEAGLKFVHAHCAPLGLTKDQFAEAVANVVEREFSELEPEGVNDVMRMFYDVHVCLRKFCPGVPEEYHVAAEVAALRMVAGLWKG